VRPEIRSEMRPKVRAEELRTSAPAQRSPAPGDPVHRVAGLRLLEAYARLAQDGEHLLQGLLAGQPPRQWSHYPESDAIDARSAYQWFYHSHSPEDRPGAVEHGHFHLFARRALWARRLCSRAERDFNALTGQPAKSVNTRHLLGIGLDCKGVPISLFTVNSWVTGDLMLSASNTFRLLANMTLDSGHPTIDAVLEAVIALSHNEIRELLVRRDQALHRHAAPDVLVDSSLEVLSETVIDLDRKSSGT